jgi:hypothetical protein
MPIDSIIVIITVIIAFGFCGVALLSLRFR